MRIRATLLIFVVFPLSVLSACDSDGGNTSARDVSGPADTTSATDAAPDGGDVAAPPVCSARAYGAVGDGETLDTEALQAAIDACKDIDGTVVVEAGDYLTGTLYLGSRMTLQLEEGATIYGSKERADYTDRYVIYGEDVSDLTIEGPGTVHGNGEHWWASWLVDPEHWRPKRLIRIAGCENLTIRDLKMRDSANWHLHFSLCDNVLIDGVHIRAKVDDNTFSPNTDGIDIEGSRHVEVRNCDIETGDDAVVLKNGDDENGREMYDIEIHDCVLASWANAFKIGTRPHHPVHDVIFRDSVVRASVDSNPGTRAMGAITLIADAGADVYGITAENIHIEAVHSPFFLRVQERADEEVPVPTQAGRLYDVVLRNITCDDALEPGLVMGIPGHPVESVTIEDVTINSTASGTLADREIDPPERNLEYPDSIYFGTFPAFGLYARHVSGPLALEDTVTFTSTAAEEGRAAVIFDDVADYDVSGLAPDTELIDRSAE